MPFDKQDGPDGVEGIFYGRTLEDDGGVGAGGNVPGPGIGIVGVGVAHNTKHRHVAFPGLIEGQSFRDGHGFDEVSFQAKGGCDGLEQTRNIFRTAHGARLRKGNGPGEGNPGQPEPQFKGGQAMCHLMTFLETRKDAAFLVAKQAQTAPGGRGIVGQRAGALAQIPAQAALVEEGLQDGKQFPPKANFAPMGAAAR